MKLYVVYEEYEGKEYSHRYFQSRTKAVKALEIEQEHAKLCGFECCWYMKNIKTED